MANAMNGNYKHQSGKETWLHDYDVLTFIVDYMGKINGTNNRINPDEIILKNRSSTQTIQYIADQMSVNIKNCIKKNIKILIRIYIEYKMKMASAQVKSCILLASLVTRGTTVIIEPEKCRDHTEIMMRDLGLKISCENLNNGTKISYSGLQEFDAKNFAKSLIGI
jgi:hypothetical protein